MRKLKKISLTFIAVCTAFALTACSTIDVKESMESADKELEYGEDNAQPPVGNTGKYLTYDISTDEKGQTIIVNVGESRKIAGDICYILDPQLDTVYAYSESHVYGGWSSSLSQAFSPDGTPMTIEDFLVKYPLDLSAWGYRPDAQDEKP